MVAFTDTQFLPYQVGNDRPCDSWQVLCQMATMLDAAFLGVDNALARVEPAIPLAIVSRETDLVFVNEDQVTLTWEAAEVDTDNMVDFSRSTADILPNRTGMYIVNLYGEFTGSTGGGDETALSITSGGVDTATRDDELRNPGSGSYFLRSTAAIHFSGFDSLGAVENIGFGGQVTLSPSGPITISRVILSAYWINDRSTT